MDTKAAASKDERQGPRQTNPTQPIPTAEVAAFGQFSPSTPEAHLGSRGTSSGFSSEVVA